MGSFAELLSVFDKADTAHRSAMAVGAAQSGLDGPMAMYQTQSVPTLDINAARSARDAAIRALRERLAGDQGRLAQLDVYIDLKHQPSAQVRKGARRQLMS